MTQCELLEILEKHRKWLEGEDGGECASMRGANLRGADLYNCCLPLWCGGLYIKLDRRRMAQLIYRFCNMECEDSEVLALQKSLYAFANEFAESRDDLKNKKFPEVAAQREDK